MYFFFLLSACQISVFVFFEENVQYYVDRFLWEYASI